MKYSVWFAHSRTCDVVAVGLAAVVMKQSAELVNRQMMSAVAEMALADATDDPSALVRITGVAPRRSSGTLTPF